MKNVPDTILDGVKYGYVHQPKKSKALKKKIAKLESFGCTEIVVDIGSRENFDAMLEKATFRDFLYLYDHSVFLSIEDVEVLSDIMPWMNDEPMRPDFDVYDRSLYPFACEEDTLWMRKRRAQEQSSFWLLYFFSRMFRLPRLPNFPKGILGILFPKTYT